MQTETTGQPIAAIPTTPPTEIQISDDMETALRSMFGVVNTLRHIVESPTQIQAEEIELLAEVLDASRVTLAGVHRTFEAARKRSRDEMEKLEARIAELEEERKATPAGQLDNIKTWGNMIRAVSLTALQSLDRMGQAA